VTTLPDFSLEQEWAAHGLVCGVDEAGRGPWAGPVSAAAVILDVNNLPAGLNDSKALSEAAREEAEAAIKAQAVCWSVAFATVEEIDRLNILRATELAMRRAVQGLAHCAALALIDGNHALDVGCRSVAVIKGDARSMSIAAASILAKTARDRLMHELEREHPGYGFARNKGYGVPLHRQALDHLGPCAQHRRSFAPIRSMIEKRPSA
jgi:ribonuclease HII